MQKDDFRRLLESWVKNLSRVNDWFETQPGMLTIKLEGAKLYQMVQTMWFDYRDVFPNKGCYKMIRRLIIKNIARFWSLRPGYLCNIPAELCKEILHKADQKWISFDRELQVNFREYLIWSAAQAGYKKRRSKYLCYVNDNLEVVFDKSEATGFVNLISKPQKQVEILFFKPLVYTDVSKPQAVQILDDWGKSCYPKFRAYIPTLATCLIANEFLSSACLDDGLFVHSCFIDRYGADGGQSFVLNDEAHVEMGYVGAKAKRLYVSLNMSLDEFIELNPRAGFPHIYITSWCREDC